MVVRFAILKVLWDFRLEAPNGFEPDVGLPARVGRIIRSSKLMQNYSQLIEARWSGFAVGFPLRCGWFHEGLATAASAFRSTG